MKNSPKSGSKNPAKLPVEGRKVETLSNVSARHRYYSYRVRQQIVNGELHFEIEREYREEPSIPDRTRSKTIGKD